MEPYEGNSYDSRSRRKISPFSTLYPRFIGGRSNQRPTSQDQQKPFYLANTRTLSQAVSKTRSSGRAPQKDPLILEPLYGIISPEGI